MDNGFSSAEVTNARKAAALEWLGYATEDELRELVFKLAAELELEFGNPAWEFVEGLVPELKEAVV